MTALDATLANITLLGLDTAPVIYFVEQNPAYFPLVFEIFRRIHETTITGCSSVLTLTEVLIHPKRAQDRHLEQVYRSLLLNSANVLLINTNPAIADTAADLRARYSLLTPDAIQIATALQASCDAFLTNDRRLQRVTELRILILDELTL
jgi:predicted nucleic acid-binding protein